MGTYSMNDAQMVMAQSYLSTDTFLYTITYTIADMNADIEALDAIMMTMLESFKPAA